MELLFTPASLLSLLSQIEEFQDIDIGITEGLDGNLQLSVGDSIYEINAQSPTEVEVAPEVADEVAEANENTYSELAESADFDIEEQEPVEAGLLKELLKSLAIGGMVRLTKKLLK